MLYFNESFMSFMECCTIFARLIAVFQTPISVVSWEDIANDSLYSVASLHALAQNVGLHEAQMYRHPFSV